MLTSDRAELCLSKHLMSGWTGNTGKCVVKGCWGEGLGVGKITSLFTSNVFTNEIEDKKDASTERRRACI